MQRRSILKGALAATALPLAAQAQGRDLTVVSWGGAYQDAQREVFFRPFQQQTRNRLLEETWDGGIGVLRSRIASGANTWDVVQVESEELLIGADEGLFEPMDWAAIGGRDAYIPEAFHEHGVGAILYSFILAYDRARLAEGPAGWADFFDTRRFPGKRGLRKGPKSTLEIALMGDGVPPDQVYRLLGTAAGVDRAFRKLDSVKADLAWFERGSQPPQWLAAGEVTMTVAYNGRISAANQTDGRNFAIVWKNNIFTLDTWVIMKGSPNKARALEFLRFAGRPEIQAGLPPKIPYGVTAKGVNERLPPDLLPNLPTAPQNMQNALHLSDRFWLDNLDRLTQRFNTWVSR
jgi:putative spermidine/putrescine transport system substrate-binding protein